MLAKSLLSIALIAQLATPAVARADRESNIMAGMLFALVMGGAGTAIIGPDIRNHYYRDQVRSVEFEKAGLKMHMELGPRYESVIAAMTRRESPETLAWIQKAGPASAAAFEAYVKIYKR